MDVTVTVQGGDIYEFTVTDETYADLLNSIGLSPHEVSVVVSGRPVPEDQPVEATEITVIQLIKGG